MSRTAKLPKDEEVITFRLGGEALKTLRLITDQEGTPASQQIRRALELWWKRKGVKLKSKG